MARNIWLITAVHDIQLQVCHIPGKRNVIAEWGEWTGAGNGFHNRTSELENFWVFFFQNLANIRKIDFCFYLSSFPHSTEKAYEITGVLIDR